MTRNPDADDLLRKASGAATDLARILEAARSGQGLSVDEWQETAAALGQQLAVYRNACAEINNSYGLTSAQQRLLRYLQTHVGEVVDGDRLAGVSAIHEWARRVRELRVEHGWRIETGVQRPDLTADQYVLTSLDPDTTLAERWRLAKTIRGLPISGKDRVLKLLKAVSPAFADKDEISYVAKIKDWARRVRELQEEGWQIDSNLDDPTLAPGSYRMVSLDKNPPRVRKAMKLRYEVMGRDNFRCVDCGKTPKEARKRFEVHHLVMVSRGGTNEAENLVTLCSDCHAGRHAVMPGSTRDDLLAPGVESTYKR